MIPSGRIKTFKELWKKNFGEELNDTDAHKKASQLLRTIRMIYKPITENELKQLQKRREELKNL